MRRAYLLIIIPAAIVGVAYVALFRMIGLPIHVAPFLGAAAAFVVAVLCVRHYLRRHVKRPGRQA